MALFLVTGPAVEPITLERVKANLRITHEDEDDDLLDMIQTAREWAEEQTGRQLITATYRWTLDRFPCDQLVVPRPPLQAVDTNNVSLVTVQYVDTGGETQTLAADQYTVTAPSGPRAGPGTIDRAYGVTWPTTQCVANAVTVSFTAGYGDAATAVPALIRREMMRKVGSLYEHREDVLADQFGQGVMELPSNAGRFAGFVVYPMGATS